MYMRINLHKRKRYAYLVASLVKIYTRAHSNQLHVGAREKYGAHAYKQERSLEKILVYDYIMCRPGVQELSVTMAYRDVL